MFSTLYGDVDGIVGIQVDDTVCTGSPTFLEKEENGSPEFSCSTLAKITESEANFNGIDISIEMVL